MKRSQEFGNNRAHASATTCVRRIWPRGRPRGLPDPNLPFPRALVPSRLSPSARLMAQRYATTPPTPRRFSVHQPRKPLRKGPELINFASRATPPQKLHRESRKMLQFWWRNRLRLRTITKQDGLPRKADRAKRLFHSPQGYLPAISVTGGDPPGSCYAEADTNS